MSHALVDSKHAGSLRARSNSLTPEVSERLKLGEGVVGHVALTGVPANVPDASKDWRFDAKCADDHTVY